MRFSSRSMGSLFLSFATAIVIASGFFVTSAWGGSAAHAVKANTAAHVRIDCSSSRVLCADVGESDEIFGHYVGHDEPAVAFYSNRPGSGNQMRYQLTLPKDPSTTNPTTPGKSYNFELHPAFWFSMVMCDTQSYPEQVSTCTPDSDTNIVDPTVSTKHPGAAFTELQFYPPGWVPPAFFNTSCDPTRWCVALTIDSLSVDPIAGTLNNAACLAAASQEPANFAFLTKSGVPQAPASPLLQTLATFTPDPTKALFMNSGDTLRVTMHDTAHGLYAEVDDLTTGQRGSTTASAANGFAQVLFDPNGTNCDPATHNLPYDFHPMYSTSSEKTNAVWAAHTLNVAFSDEIGHFDFCNGPNAITPGGNCPTGNTEENGSSAEPTDGDDAGCFPASSSLLVQVSGCDGTNTGFDGVPYQTVWPDGNTKLHPTAVMFSSPLTGSGYNVNYNRMAFEADIPAIEAATNPCDTHTGAGCTLIPLTDDGNPAAFYPFYSIRNTGNGCVWQLGNHIPGSKNDFGQNAQYGTLLNSSSYLFGGGGLPRTRYFNYRQVLSQNPCRA